MTKSMLPIDRIKAVVDGVAERQSEMAAIWGLGRLRLLVDVDLRERFDRQCRKFETLCADQRTSAEEIEAAGAGVERGLIALDEAASAAGHARIDSDVWEIELTKADGSRCVGAIIKDGRDVMKARLLTDGREVVVFTLQEVQRILCTEHLLGVCAVKEVFPGAVLTDCRPASPHFKKEPADECADLFAAG